MSLFGWLFCILMTQDPLGMYCSKVTTSDKQYLSFLQVPVLKFSYNWTIENFSYCVQEVGEFLRSPEFSVGINNEVKWCLNLYPRGQNEEDSNFTALFVELCAAKSKTAFAEIECAILDFNLKHGMKKYVLVNQTWGWQKICETYHLFNKELLPGDKLTIVCDISMVVPLDEAENKNNLVKEDEEPRLSNDFALVLKTGHFSDITLNVNGREFRSHKVILAARSPVFSAMFEHETNENGTDVVNIDDFDSEVINAMLHFIYTGDAPNLDKEIAMDLFAASNKYSIDRLKTICEVFLSLHLTVDTAADFLYLADMHNAKYLKDNALDFIRDHAEEIIDISSWKLLADRRPVLLLEVFRKMAVHQNTQHSIDIESNQSCWKRTLADYQKKTIHNNHVGKENRQVMDIEEINLDDIWKSDEKLRFEHIFCPILFMVVIIMWLMCRSNNTR